MTRDASAAMTATVQRSGRYRFHMGAELRVLLMALLFLVATDVRCITTANAKAQGPQPASLVNHTAFQQFEADALNAVLKNWTSGDINQQLFNILGWSPRQHPCNMSAETVSRRGFEYEGAWRGVFCTPVLQEGNSTGNYHILSVTSLTLYGSNMSCGPNFYRSEQCGFQGIQGVLPSEIAQLTNLVQISINFHPKLKGAVPLQIWQMPNLTTLQLVSNSLQGTLPSKNLGLSSTLEHIDLNNNHFSGMLEVSSKGTLFSSSLRSLNLLSNHMYGQVNFQWLLNDQFETLDLTQNNFNGTFSSGPYFNPKFLYLSNNSFTGFRFSNYSGSNYRGGFSTVYMPYLFTFYASDNHLGGSFPREILLMPYLKNLDLSGNRLAGSFPVEIITKISSLDVSRNRFSGPLDFQRIIPRSKLEYSLESLNFSKNLFDGYFSSGPNFNPRELDLSHNFFNHFNFDSSNLDGALNVYMPRLQKLYMGNNNVSGVFPIHILKAPLLEALYADHNQFNVLQLPSVKFENFSFMRFGIFLTNNKIKNDKIEYQSDGGGPFSEYNLQFSNYLFLAGNPLCENIDTPLLSAICRMNQSDDRPPLNKRFSRTIKAIIASSTSSFGLILFIIFIYVWRLMRRIQSLGMVLKEFDKREVKPNLYTYKDIKLATNNFDKRNKLGEGGFGVVYKGVLSDGTLVAVKKLIVSSSQILSEFLNEVVVISGLIHRNLVKLKGCCLGDGDQRILVFEYVENKNLAEALLFSDDKEESNEPIYLDWASRLNIIVGIARGLAYLHEDLQSPVIHRDIKATNILLDKDYNPKIADFGLAYLFPTLKNNESHLTMEQVAGTRGYCAPEYALHGHMSTANDVYSFGILVLEIICGRKNVELQKTGEEIILQEWAWKLFEEQNSIALFDPRMKYSSLDVEAITRVINVALACIQFKAALRPKMHEVGHMLLGSMPINMINEHSRGVALSFNMDLDATSSCGNNNVSIDELSILSNPCEIEMSRSSSIC